MTPDWSAAYTPNAGPMDAVIKVQLTAERSHRPSSTSSMLRDGAGQGSEIRRPRVRLRRRRHDACGHERREVDADQHPRHRQGPGEGPPDRLAIKEQVAGIDGVVDARIIQRLELSRVHDRRRPHQGGRPGADPGRRHAERGGGVQFEHPVQQEEFLDRPESARTSTSSASSTPRRTSSRSRRCSTSP